MNELELFAAAIAVADPAERAALLDRECAIDPAKRVRLEALLRAHDRPDSLLDRPAVAPHDPDAASTRTIGHEGGAAAGDEVPLGLLAPATRPDSLGRIGHYEVLQVLGRGGFGIVFRAFDEMLQRVVALKVMAPQLAATSPARKRFLREARSSAQVRHENVVQVYEVAEQPLPYLAMEFIPGETLQQKLDRIGPLDVPEVLRIGRQIAEGLAAAHATDLIHRDIKPGNVLLEGGQQKVKITDFGLARAADDASISQSGIIAGTPMYMAPEQAQGQTLDQRADLFSLGSVLYQMVAGRPPFRATGTLAVLKRVAEDQPRAIREVIPETPQWLCDIIAKLHAKDPDDRYQSAREVADVLADCEAQLKANAKVMDFSRIPRGTPIPRQSGRRKWVAALALLLLLCAAAWFTPAASRYFGNRGELEFAPDPGLTAVIVWRDGTPVTDWIDVKNRPTIQLPPGQYQLEAAFQPGRSLERWELRDVGLFSTLTSEQGGRTCELNLERGQRLNVRVVLHDQPAPMPSPPKEEPLLPTFKNSIGMEFVIVPKGKCWLGGGKDKLGDRPWPLPRDFYLGKYLVTQEEWQQVMGKNPSHFSRDGDGREAVKYVFDADLKRFPVEQVSWDDAQEFLAKLNERDKKGGWVYRLPNESEWEYACRGGPMADPSESAFDYYFEKPTNQLLPDQANFEHGKGLKRTCAVGSYQPNRLGLYDMHGNVWEWSDEAEGGQRVVRGGCCFRDAVECRAASRYGIHPARRLTDVGLRVARVPSVQASK